MESISPPTAAATLPSSSPATPEPGAEFSVAPSTPTRARIVIVEPRTSLDDHVPSSLFPLKSPSTPSSHTLPIGRSKSITGRNRSDSVGSSSHAGAMSPPTPTRQSPLPGGAAALAIPSQPNRLSVASSISLTPSSPTSTSSTHIGNILAPASFFRPSRPNSSISAQMSTSRSVPTSIGPTSSTTQRTSANIHTLTLPRKSGAIPESAIPLASFAQRRTSMQGHRVSRSSTLSDHHVSSVAEDVHEGDVVIEMRQQPRPMASREPLLTPMEQSRAQQHSRRLSAASPPPHSPVVAAVRGSLDRIFRRSLSGDSLRHDKPSLVTKPMHLAPVSDDSHLHTKDLKPARFTPPSEKLSVVSPVWMKPMGISRFTGKLGRNWELHQGANKFFLAGRVVLGGDTPFAFLGTLTVWCVFVGFWMGTTCVWWWQNLSPALAGVGVYMCLITLSSLLYTAFRDPGILPRDLDLDAPIPYTSDGDSVSAVPLPRDVRVRDESVRTKYCATCKTYRPPRSGHCRTCDNCVDSWDHHCPWVNNCVGRRNYSSFITCLVTAVLSLILILISSAIHLSELSKRENLSFKDTLEHGFGSAVVFGCATVFIWPVGALMTYHVYLLVMNRTTIEQMRVKTHKSLADSTGEPQTNPFTFGSWYYNVAYMMYRPAGYSWVEPHAVATHDVRDRPPVDYDEDDRWSRSDII